MNRAVRLAVSIALAFAAPVLLQAQGAPERAPQARRAATADAAMARVIVRFAADSDLTRAQALSQRGELRHAAALSQRLGMTLADGRSIDARTQVVVASGVDADVLAWRIAQTAGVESATVDRKRHLLAAPNDPLYASAASPAVGQWYLRAPDATIVSAINAEAAWDVTPGSSSVVVAVLDTGVRKDHPDLASKLLAGYDFVSADSTNDFTTANDGDGRDADPSDPGDWDSSSTSSWHGTQTSGLIGAATDNGIGMASVGRNVMVLPVRVLGVGGGWDSDIQAGMRWAAGLSVPGVTTNPNPAKVINMSLGAAGSCGSSTGYPAVISEITAAGAVIVVSAGNDGLAVNEPANCTGVVAVAGVRHTGTKVGYSSLGPQVAIAAPAGNCVNLTGACLYPLLTTTNTGTTVPATNTYSTGGGDASIGTSFSAPLVSGTLGLMFSINPSLTVSQAISTLKSTVRTFPSSGAGTGVSACHAPTSTAQDSECYCTTTTCGAGMLDTRAAVAAAAALVPVTAVITPSATSMAVGESLTLSASNSSVASGRTIASYLWTVTSSTSSASFIGATDASTATLSGLAAGTATVTLTVTDSSGGVDTASQAITVTGTTTSSGGGGGGGGGGAMTPGWLLALIAAIALLRAPVRRRS